MAVKSDFLGLLVDGDLIIGAYVIRLEEGIAYYWPPNAYDREARIVEDALSVPLRPGLYFIVGGDTLIYKYMGLVIGKSVLLFRVSEAMPVERLAEKLSKTYMLFINKKYQGTNARMNRRNMNGREIRGM